MGRVVRGNQRSPRATAMGKAQPAEDTAAAGRALDRERVQQEKRDEAARASHTKVVEGSQHRTY